MAFDYDSDDTETGEPRYSSYGRGNASNSNNKPTSSSRTSNTGSILKSSLKKPMYSDDDDDDNYNSGRLSSQRNRNDRYDSPPIHSYRSSDSKSAKPPSGRMQPLQPISSSARSTSDYGNSKRQTSISNHKSTINDDPDSDDSFMQRYQKFTKSKTEPLHNDYSSSNKFSSTKYDTYDEDEKSNNTND